MILSSAEFELILILLTQLTQYSIVVPSETENINLLILFIS